MNKKGFTLVELLAVIAILAILVIVAMPNVLGMFNQAKVNLFVTEVQKMMDISKSKFTSEPFSNGGQSIYYSSVENDELKTKELDISGNKKEYFIEMDRNGEFKRVVVYDKNFCYDVYSDYGSLSIGDISGTKSKPFFENKIDKSLVNSNDLYYSGNDSNVASVSVVDGKVTSYYVKGCEGVNSYAGNIVSYSDGSGANSPVLLENMIPVKYYSGKWYYADYTKQWYDYNNKQWANAVVLKNGITKSVGDQINMSDIAMMYVWIPRFKYTLFNNSSSVLIDVKFENGINSTGSVSCSSALNQKDSNGNLISEICVDLTKSDNKLVYNSSTYTHPAFTFGNTELEGFWVGKFEISGSSSEIIIKPNENSLILGNVSLFSNSINKISDFYDIDGSSHMIRNMEWGAVAYLKQSKYGIGNVNIGINNYYNSTNSKYSTGCGSASGSSVTTICHTYDKEGVIASTTGNIYGIYDMSGGTYEYVMGNMVSSGGLFNTASSGFTSNIESKFYDSYSYSASYSDFTRGLFGDATKEVLNNNNNYNGAWFNDSAYFVYSNGAWFARGGSASSGSAAGIFRFDSSSGSDNRYGSRAVIIK